MNKIAYAVAKNTHVTCTKINRALAKICGKQYKDVLVFLQTLPQKNKIIIWKTLNSAIYNLMQKNSGLEKTSIVVTEAFATRGAMLKRMQPRAKGKAFRIEKKKAHLTIKVNII